MRRPVATILSLITLTGGHYLNRRWDRAALFLGLLFVGMAAAYFLLVLDAQTVEGTDAHALFASYQHKVRLLLMGVALLLLLSAWVTWRDSRVARPELPWRGALPVLGAVLTTTFSLVLMAYLGMMGSVYLALGRDAVTVSQGEVGEADTSVVSRRAPAYSADTTFRGMLYFGGRNFPGVDAEPFPSGSAYLVGQVLFEGEPVAGAEIRLMINGAHPESTVRTDATGRYSLRVPPGNWSVNEIQVETWPGMPRQGGYMLVSGLEASGDLNRERYPLFMETGLPVEATAAPELNPSLVVHIRKTLDLYWPTVEDKPVSARVDEAVIRWSAYPQAVHYRVKISEVTRHGNTTSYRPVVRKVVTGATELPLAGLAAVPDDAAAHEYAVEVIAMRADGSFLSENRQSYRGATFTLADGNRLLADDKQRLLEQGTSVDDIQAMFKNDARLDAVVILIREDLLAPAETLLDKVGIASPGRKLAVTGFLRARQARCDDAQALLTQAKTEGGSLCVPAEYWAGCR